jgi:hypothetical protein
MKFIHPEKLDVRLIDGMEAYERYLQRHFPKAEVIVHNDWAEKGHTENSRHYLGEAVDFHVVGVSALEAFLALERFTVFGGVGYYPEWRPVAGFHADVRDPIPYRARWARVTNAAGKQEYVALDRKIVEGMTA